MQNIEFQRILIVYSEGLSLIIVIRVVVFSFRCGTFLVWKLRKFVKEFIFVKSKLPID